MKSLKQDGLLKCVKGITTIEEVMRVTNIDYRDNIMKKKRILIVDDMRESLLALKIRLEYNGYEVYTAADGEAGLNAARSLKPDIILLDVMLPKIDGFSICRLLKFDKEYASIPIIMVTVKNQTSDKEIGKQVGANAYITKPYNAKELLEKIKELTSNKPIAASNIGNQL